MPSQNWNDFGIWKVMVGIIFFFFWLKKRKFFLGKNCVMINGVFFLKWLFHYDQWLCKHRYMRTAFCSLYGVFTAVLSRNPIHDIGDSLVKVKSITKVRVCLKWFLFLFSSFLSTNVTLENCTPFSYPSQIVEFRPLDLPSNIVWIWKRSDLLTTRSRYILLMSSLSCKILL